VTRVARWKRGDATLWKVVDQWLAGAPAAQEFASNERRQVVRLRSEQGVEVVVKRFLPRHRVQRLINRGRRALGQSPAQKEWRALSRLRSVGLNVPDLLALARLQDGGELLVLRFIPGIALEEALASDRRERHRLLTAMGEQVALLHSTRWVHRDLHTGNFVIDEQGRPALLDFQRARRPFTTIARTRDRGALDFSLAQAGFSIADRMRLRCATLGISGRPGPSERLALLRAGKASSKFAARHFKSRTKRCLRPGRLYARVDVEGQRGLRLRSVPGEAIAQALAIHRAVQTGDGELRTRGEILKRDHSSRVTATSVDGRSFVVKEVVKPGRGRLLADALRGSPARRAWRGGHGLLARGIRAATPLAFVEVRHWMVPVASTVVLEDLRPALPANELATAAPDQLAETLRRLAVALHRRGVVHGDFQAPHIYLSDPSVRSEQSGRGDQLESALIDLEGVRFRKRLSDDQRIQSLAELNASLPDELLSACERRRAFERYAQVLPFAKGEAAQSERLGALAEIARRSLARSHLWQGEGCGEELGK